MSPERVTAIATNDAALAMNALRRIVRALRLSSRASEHASGISSAQLFVLHELAERPAASVRELAARTLTDASSVSVVVSRLRERGLVRCVNTDGDQRRVRISLAPAGRAVLRKAPEPAQARLVEALERLPRRRLASLTSALTALADAMAVTGGPAPMFFEDDAARPPRQSRKERSIRHGRA